SIGCRPAIATARQTVLVCRAGSHRVGIARGGSRAGYARRQILAEVPEPRCRVCAGGCVGGVLGSKRVAGLPAVVRGTWREAFAALTAGRSSAYVTNRPRRRVCRGWIGNAVIRAEPVPGAGSRCARRNIPSSAFPEAGAFVADQESAQERRRSRPT